MIQYRVYIQDLEFRIEFKGQVNLDVGGFRNKLELDRYLEWCRGSRWNGAKMLQVNIEPPSARVQEIKERVERLLALNAKLGEEQKLAADSGNINPGTN